MPAVHFIILFPREKNTDYNETPHSRKESTMDHETETIEPYTSREFAQDVAKSVAGTVISVVAAYAILGIAGYVATKVMDHKAKKTLTEN